MAGSPSPIFTGNPPFGFAMGGIPDIENRAARNGKIWFSTDIDQGSGTGVLVLYKQ